MFILNSDIIINIICILNLQDLINIYNSDIILKSIINDNSEYIIKKILFYHKINIIISDFSINLKTNLKVLSIQKTRDILSLNQLLKNKNLFKLINDELFK